MFVTRLHKAIVNKKGKHPVVLQITWNRNVRRKRIGIWARPNQLFIDDEGKARLREIDGKKTKQKKLKLYEKTAKRIFEDDFEDQEFDYNEFCEKLDSSIKIASHKKIKIKVGEFCEQVSENFKKSGQIRSSMDYNLLKELILKISPNDLTFSELNITWLQNLENYFNAKGTRGFDYMNRIKVLYNKAIQSRLVDFNKNPFKNPYTNPYGYDVGKLKKRRVAKTNSSRIKDLTKEELKLVNSYKPRTAKEEEYLDAWFFSFYMFGVNLTDIARLEKSHIKDGRWFYTRSKTRVGLKRGKPILPEAMEIIERSIKRTKGSKYVFPILTNGYDKDELKAAKRINNYAGHIRKMSKKICQRIGLNGYFTYYSARYTSATIALNGGADRNTVSHLLDHINFSTIDHYAGRADDIKIKEVMKLLKIS